MGLFDTRGLFFRCSPKMFSAYHYLCRLSHRRLISCRSIACRNRHEICILSKRKTLAWITRNEATYS